ncbi:UNVERIFIED_CONTAM: Beta-glucosidase 18 [Sesamum calycinum]|uniref:Beta-glucosidase 18 n=1 Tax=Sesamum calycinum TaxID=2727403 RepID=A0AAW2MBI1_9LAMI
MENIKITWVFVSYCLILLLSAAISPAEEQVNVKRSDFPHGFHFGATTSAYQVCVLSLPVSTTVFIFPLFLKKMELDPCCLCRSFVKVEGAVHEDGKGLSNWDVYCRIQGDKPQFLVSSVALCLILCSCLFVAVEFDFWCVLRFSGNIVDGTNGDIANDHYHRYMSLGLTAYRFSISWSRVLPRGRHGGVNQAGINFYNSIIDNLLLRGIQPFVTIFHNEYPQELEDRFGGWLSPDSFHWTGVLMGNYVSGLTGKSFVHFSETCFKHFADRVQYWMTMNEPNLLAEAAYEKGRSPPARCSPPFGHCASGNSDVEPLVAVHNMLLAHARAAKLYHEQYKSKVNGVIGITVCAYMYIPLREIEDDTEAANRALALMLLEMKRYHGSELPNFSLEERELVRDSIDFIGINHYGTLYAKDCIHSSCICNDSTCTLGMSEFFVVPRGMEGIVNYIKERYHNKPMFVTENGYSSPGNEDDIYGHDVKRIHYHQSYLASLAQAVRNGADVRGYFIWSFMDNFEWSNGYRLKFGIYRIDRQTLNRIPKLSATWYRDFLSNSSLGGVNLSSTVPDENKDVSMVHSE